jgi:hypothetical protein
MSDSPLPCAEKLAFDTFRDAQAAATASQWRYGSKLKVYHCRHCQLYHLSSNPDD